MRRRHRRVVNLLVGGGGNDIHGKDFYPLGERERY
jgi:hypothetical protein